MNLFGFFFLSPLTALLALGGAASVPVIIHLLNRRRFRVVTWAAMRFLLAAQKQNSRRLRVEQWLLLAVRTLLVVLLVVAMACVTPWAESLWQRLFPDSLALAGTGQRRTHKVLVLDGSFSMATRGPDGTAAFDRARELAARLVQESQGGDGFSVILMGAPPRRAVGEPAEDGRKVVKEIQGLRLPHGNADLPGALAAIEDLIRQSPGKFEEREVYFFTDLQQATWAGQSLGLKDTLGKIQARARSVLVDVGHDNPSNLAVADVALLDVPAGTGGFTPVRAIVTNFGEPKEGVRLELWVGKARHAAADAPLEMRVAAQMVERIARGSNAFTFKHRFTTPGDYVLQARLEHDALDLDDVRSAAVTVKTTVPVLVVNGKPAERPFDGAAEWLRLALNPFEDRVVPGGAGAKPRVILEPEFANAALDLNQFDAVYLCDVKRLSQSETRRLEAFLRRGGGVVIAAGDNLDLAAYNDSLYRDGSGLLPARLVGKRQAEGKQYFYLSAPDKAYEKPPLLAFAADEDRSALRSARFRQFLRTEPAPRFVPEKVLTYVLAQDGSRATETLTDAAVLSWQPPLAPAPPDRGRGTVPCRGRTILLTTTVNMDWTTWPASPSFLPFTQELLRHAVSGRLREQASTVGDTLDEYLDASGGGLEATVQTPDGRAEAARTQAYEDGSVLRWGDTDVSGLYRVRIGSHPREHLFAVNVPAATDGQSGSESDPTRLDRDRLQKLYPEWEYQLVTELKDVSHTGGTSGTAELVYRPLGPVFARWLLLGVLALVLLEVALAWHFGHHTAAGTPGSAPAEGKVVPGAIAGLAAVVCLAVAFVLGHAAWTGDFLGFVPDGPRSWVESVLGIPPPAPGEGSRWRLEFLPYFRDAASDPWLAGLCALGGAVLIGWIYRREGSTAGVPYRLLMASLRICLLLLTLSVLLPQLRLWFERQGWPDVAILVDDSQSMSEVDRYRDPKVREAAEGLAKVANLPQAQRLQLAQALLTHPEHGYLRAMLLERQVKLHVYRCSDRAHRIGDATEEKDLKELGEKVAALTTDPKHDSSRLGTAVRQVLNDFRGSSLSAIVMLTDGVNTEGEDLPRAAKYASQVGVPLYLVGIGDSLEPRDLELHDLQVEDAVYVNDKVVFECRLTAHGYTDGTATVRLREKGKNDVLAEQRVTFDPQGKSVKVRLVHSPKEPGEKTFIIDTPVREDEVRADNNALERRIWVHETKQIKVFYAEGYPRYEFRYLKSLLERESDRVKGNKSIDLKVYLQEADADFAVQDRSALADWPTKAELLRYDVVILGDVDPRVDRATAEHLKDIAEFVREKGGGLLMIAGERHAPHAYRNTAIHDVLPIEVVADAQPDDPEGGRPFGYRPELTPVGRMHPIFRFTPDERESEEVWKKLRELYWWSEGYRTKPAAEVLAVVPKDTPLRGAGGRPLDGHPLMVQHFVGSGRCMFFGVNETWRWRFREDELRFNQFWIQTVRYLSRSRLGRIELRLDRQTPYRRGEPIKVTVRFPDDSPPPDDKAEVQVVVERKRNAAAQAADVERQTVKLARVEGSRTTFEWLHTRTPEGDYRFWLGQPDVAGQKPEANCKVLAPPGEMERLMMNQPDLERAAEETRGKFYTLADAENLPSDLPAGTRVTLNTPGPPALLWNQPTSLLLALALLTAEWVLRKRKWLL